MQLSIRSGVAEQPLLRPPLGGVMPDTKHAIAALFPFGEQRDERQSELAAGKMSDRVEETRGFARPSILELCGLVVERHVYVSALEQFGER